MRLLRYLDNDHVDKAEVDARAHSCVDGDDVVDDATFDDDDHAHADVHGDTNIDDDVIADN